jgi:hypothetical protein
VPRCSSRPGAAPGLLPNPFPTNERGDEFHAAYEQRGRIFVRTATGDELTVADGLRHAKHAQFASDFNDALTVVWQTRRKPFIATGDAGSGFTSRRSWRAVATSVTSSCSRTPTKPPSLGNATDGSTLAGVSSRMRARNEEGRGSAPKADARGGTSTASGVKNGTVSWAANGRVERWRFSPGGYAPCLVALGDAHVWDSNSEETLRTRWTATSTSTTR